MSQQPENPGPPPQAGVPMEVLHFTIVAVTAPPGALSKGVQVRWWTREHGAAGAQVTLLGDSITVGPMATDDEILEAIRQRKVDIGPSLTYVRPNPEANAALVGHEE